MASRIGIESINPLQHVGEAKYSAIWQKLFVTMLAGFWGRLFFLLCIFAAIFFAIRRRNTPAAAVFALCAAVIAFGAGIANIISRF